MITSVSSNSTANIRLCQKKAKPCIEFVSDGAERMKELISVLAFSRVVRIESETATMDLNKVKTYYEL